MWTLAEKSGHIPAKEGCQLPEDRKIKEETLSYGLQEKLAPCSLALGSLFPRTMKGHMSVALNHPESDHLLQQYRTRMPPV